MDLVVNIRRVGVAGAPPGGDVLAVPKRRADVLVKTKRWELVPGEAALPIGSPAELERREARRKVEQAEIVRADAALTAKRAEEAKKAEAEKQAAAKKDEDEVLWLDEDDDVDETEKE